MKRAIPGVPRPGDSRQRFDEAMRENLQEVIGQRSTPLVPLASTASLADVIAKLNEIIARLQ